MSAEPERRQTLSLTGEIVEIVDESGRRFAKVVFSAPLIIALSEADADDLHLGDRVLVQGQVVIHKEAVWTRR